MENKYGLMTNAELNIRKKALEDEYDAKKSEVIRLITRMEELDSEYIEVTDEINKRGNITYYNGK